MDNSYVLKDIYDKDGKLLVSKGTKLSKNITAKLKRFDIDDSILNTSEDNNSLNSRNAIQSKQKEVQKCSDDLCYRFSIGSSILNHSTDIINNILFDSKDEPFWIHINALSNYVDWVYTHSINVSLLSLAMAKLMNYSEDKLKNIAIGSMLHDVGRLLIPREIMLKPGKLSESEQMLIQNHSQLGYSMVNNLGLHQESLNIILQHHERINGSGYPNRLKKNEISDKAKIVMVADSIDAMTSLRPFHRDKDLNQSFLELKNDKIRYPEAEVGILETLIINIKG